MGRLVSVVVVTWNSAAFLPRCLAGVAAQTHRDLQLIVVDNASSDGSPEIAASLAPAATIIRNETNTGFSRAVNQGLGAARGEFVLLLNPDARLAHDYVERIVDALDAAGERFGSAIGLLMRGEGGAIGPTPFVDSMGIRMTRSGRHFDIAQGSPLPAGGPALASRGIRPLPGSACVEVFGVSGAAAMFRASCISDVSMDGEFLDEDFFAFREDADVAWRARLFGWRALLVPAAVAWHVRTVMPERRRELSASINLHSVKNRFLLRLKNEGLYLAMRNLPFEIGRDLVTIAAVLTIERTSLPALRWLWSNRRRVLSKRRAVQRRRVVGDRDLAGWFR